MSYEAVMEKVKSVPEEYLDEVSDLIDEVVASHKKNDEKNSFVFDSLVRHTERAEHIDEYIKKLRSNDRF